MDKKKLIRNWHRKKTIVIYSIILLSLSILVTQTGGNIMSHSDIDGALSNDNNIDLTHDSNIGVCTLLSNLNDGNNCISLSHRHRRLIPIPTPTPISMSNDTIRVYRTATGNIDILNIETEYLPYVVAAENGWAPFESMKVQAVVSRTSAYYKKEHPDADNFDLHDDSRDQVYNPDIILTDNERNSVLQTNGIILRWGTNATCPTRVVVSKIIINSWFIAGTNDTDTYKYITFNDGRCGDNITQSTIGWTTDPPSKSPWNRGAMGQSQANLLDKDEGYTWQNIIKYFYGKDITIESK